MDRRWRRCRRGRQGVPRAWPLLRQLRGRDPLGRGAAAQSRPQRRPAAPHRRGRPGRRLGLPVLRGRLRARRSSSRTAQVTQIEGDPASPISRGRLCPKGSASKQLVTSPSRVTKVRYRRPHGTEWEDLDLDTAMDMIADRVIETRTRVLAVGGRTGAVPPHAGHRQPRRSDPRQRGELPHEEALHRDGRDPDREPGADMTLLHGPRSGDLVRPRRRHHLPAGPRER